MVLDLVGRQLGDYRILSPIGAGGMGQVFLAEHVHLRKQYALKVLPPELSRDPGFVARFHDEARVMADLRHPHIVQVHTMSHADGLYYLVMDYIVGPGGTSRSLQDHLAEQPNSRLPEQSVAKWARQVLEALSYAHGRGVIHRDIKPANLLLDAQENALLTDFGLAKAVGREFILSQIHKTQQTDTPKSHLQYPGSPLDTLDIARTVAVPRGPTAPTPAALDTLNGVATFSPGGPGTGGRISAGSILGTYDYMAPEQREGGEITARTDLYAIGVLLYRLLTGKRPSGRVRDPSQVVPGLSEAWNEPVMRCMEETLANRYESAEEMLADMGEVLGQARNLSSGAPPRQLPKQEAAHRRVPPTTPMVLASTAVAPRTFTNSIGMKLIEIKPGEFTMGSPETEKDREDDETQHKVKITKPFMLGVHEVTQKQWQAVMGNNPSYFKGDDLPVETVSWDDATEFCRKLSEKEGKKYRLPMEAEWEYACRAGTTTPFHTGRTIGTAQANYDGTSTYGSGVVGVYRQKTTPVGSFPPNAWGLHDMHGNVWEWCGDWYGPYPAGDVTDPTGPTNGDGLRVLRGGAWGSNPGFCRSAFRGWGGPGCRYDGGGFRVAVLAAGVDFP